MSRVGAVTSGRDSMARSGRPPRDTTARTTSGRSAKCAAACKRGRGSGAGAEIADPQVSGVLFLPQPVGHPYHPVGEQPDVETELPGDLVDALLVLGKQIEQQGRQPA